MMECISIIDPEAVISWSLKDVEQTISNLTDKATGQVFRG